MRRYIIAVIVLIFAIVFALLAGNGAIDTENVLEVLSGGGNRAQRTIIYQVRLPRILAALSCGAALSVSGYLLQDNLNNVIASPGLLGINNGAGLFVLLSAILFPYQSIMKCLMAFLGALCAAVIVSILSSGTGMSKTSVILSGVAISSLGASLSQVIISVKPETVADKAAFSLGGFASVPWTVTRMAVPVILILLIVAVISAGALDLMLLGDETATGLGCNVKLYRGIHIVAASILAGAAVSMCGLIGFVGLIVPNFIRMSGGSKSRGSILMCILAGSAFLLISDTAARLIFFPYELPCGLIMNAIGTPFLVWMLVRKRKRLGAYD